MKSFSFNGRLQQQKNADRGSPLLTLTVTATKSTTSATNVSACTSYSGSRDRKRSLSQPGAAETNATTIDSHQNYHHRSFAPISLRSYAPPNEYERSEDDDEEMILAEENTVASMLESEATEDESLPSFIVGDQIKAKVGVERVDESDSRMNEQYYTHGAPIIKTATTSTQSQPSERESGGRGQKTIVTHQPRKTSTARLVEGHAPAQSKSKETADEALVPCTSPPSHNLASFIVSKLSHPSMGDFSPVASSQGDNAQELSSDLPVNDAGNESNQSSNSSHLPLTGLDKLRPEEIQRVLAQLFAEGKLDFLAGAPSQPAVPVSIPLSTDNQSIVNEIINPPNSSIPFDSARLPAGSIPTAHTHQLYQGTSVRAAHGYSQVPTSSLSKRSPKSVAKPRHASRKSLNPPPSKVSSSVHTLAESAPENPHAYPHYRPRTTFTTPISPQAHRTPSTGLSGFASAASVFHVPVSPPSSTTPVLSVHELYEKARSLPPLRERYLSVAPSSTIYAPSTMPEPPQHLAPPPGIPAGSPQLLPQVPVSVAPLPSRGGGGGHPNVVDYNELKAQVAEIDRMIEAAKALPRSKRRKVG